MMKEGFLIFGIVFSMGAIIVIYVVPDISTCDPIKSQDMKQLCNQAKNEILFCKWGTLSMGLSSLIIYGLLAFNSKHSKKDNQVLKEST